MAEPVLKHTINMNGTFRNATTVMFVREMTEDEIKSARANLPHMKEDPKTLVQYFSPASEKPINHPVASTVSQAIEEFRKAGAVLTPSHFGNDQEPIEAIYLPGINHYKEFKSSDTTPPDQQKFGIKLVFKDVTGATTKLSREIWAQTRPGFLHGEGKVPGFGISGSE